jgi:hypothetical protein
MLFGDRVKAPADIVDIELDWSSRIGTDAIADSQWSADAGLTLAPLAATSPKTKARVSGGDLDSAYTVTSTVTLASGRKFARAFRVLVRAL